MRSPVGSYRLTFLLPPGIAFDSAGLPPSPEGCTINCNRGLVEVLGPSREAVFNHASVLLTAVQAAKPQASIAATLESPLPVSGRDGWRIIVGAPIAFSPTSMAPYFPRKFA